jgi:hypothetical protein
MYTKVVAVLFIGIAVFTVSYSLHLKMYTPEGPGAGLFPLLIGAAMFITAVSWLVQLFRESAAEPPFTLSWGAAARVGAQVLALALFAVMFHWAGFIASAFVLIVLTAMISGERSWLALLVAALLGSVGIQYLFSALGTQF